MILIFYTLIIRIGLKIDWFTSVLVSYAIIYIALLSGNLIGNYITLNWIGFFSIILISFMGLWSIKKDIKYELAFEFEKTDLLLLWMLIFFICLALYRLELQWDEYAHWGHAIKYLDTNGRLPNANNLPIGHGAPWYPWGMSVFSNIAGYGFSGIKIYNYPIIINAVLLIQFGRMLYNINPYLNYYRSGQQLLIAALLVLLSNSLVHGYTDLAMNISLLISICYFYKILKKENINNSYLGLLSVMILVISLKESGKYLAMMLLFLMPLFFLDSIKNRKHHLYGFITLLVILSLVIYLWGLIVPGISTTTGREVGLWTIENLKLINSIKFFENAISLSLLNNSGYIYAISGLAAVFLVSKRRFISSDILIRKLQYFMIAFSLLNLMFIIAAFYLTFGVGEFVNANSFDRYTELSLLLVFMVLFVNFKLPLNSLVIPEKTFNILIVIVFILSGYYVYISNKNSFKVQDIFPEVVAQLLDETVPVDENIYYFDSAATQGLHPVKINWFLNKARKLNYTTFRIHDEFHVSSISIPDDFKYFMLIEKFAFRKCYKISSELKIMDQYVKNDYGVFYVWGSRAPMTKMLNERECSK
jgi:hypothetical protein